VKAIGAPAPATQDATAMLLSLSGADAAWPMHDLYGLPLSRIPDVIANTVTLIVEQLRGRAASRAPSPTKPSPNGRIAHGGRARAVSERATSPSSKQASIKRQRRRDI
jgi:hypothetical protein